MRDYALLLFALLLFPFVLTVGMLIHIVKELRLGHLFSMRSYAYNIALHLDKTGGAMLFNSENRTISAMAYEKNLMWLVSLIDWIFREKYHCFDAWKNEFKEKKCHQQ